MIIKKISIEPVREMVLLIALQEIYGNVMFLLKRHLLTNFAHIFLRLTIRGACTLNIIGLQVEYYIFFM